MKFYGINEVAEKFNLTKPTIRYYDQENLIPNLQRNDNGERIFSSSNVHTIQSIECLKRTGMPIKGIKKYIQLIEQGDSTLEKRLEFFIEREKQVNSQIKDLYKTLDEIKWKCDYYKEAIADGTEKYVQKKVDSLS